MDFQTGVWIGNLIVAGMALYSFVKAFGKTEGSTETQLKHSDDNERMWNIRFDALHNQMELHRTTTSEKFEKMLERLNEALLTMAREHPTKSDLQTVKMEILDRIDMVEGFRNKPIIKKVRT